MANKTRFYVLSMGFIENDVALNVLLHNQSSVDEPNKPAEWHRVPSIALLVDHPRLGWIVIDTGSHKDAMTTRWPESSKRHTPLIRTDDDLIENRLAQLGLKPRDINLVILTHMHLDHAGGLSVFCDTPAGSHVLVHEDELKQALFELYSRGVHDYGGYLRSDFDVPGIAYETIDGDLWLADDLQIITLPGHTAGQLGVRLDLPNLGTFIFASDACNSAVNYGPPPQMSPLTFNSEKYRRSLEKIRWLERQTHATVLFGHDLEQYQKLRLAPNEFYD